jgi:hypothetical protein
MNVICLRRDWRKDKITGDFSFMEFSSLPEPSSQISGNESSFFVELFDISECLLLFRMVEKWNFVTLLFCRVFNDEIMPMLTNNSLKTNVVQMAIAVVILKWVNIGCKIHLQNYGMF